MAVRESFVQVSAADLARGVIALATACILIRLFNLETIVRLIKWSKRRCIRAMNLKEVWIVWSAIHRAKKGFWIRVACLESSLAFLLLALSQKLAVDWCIGVKLAPFESHAWIEVNGFPFQESENVQSFIKILTV